MRIYKVIVDIQISLYIPFSTASKRFDSNLTDIKETEKHTYNCAGGISHFLRTFVDKALQASAMSLCLLIFIFIKNVVNE